MTNNELKKLLTFHRKQSERLFDEIAELYAENDALRAKLGAPHEAVEADVIRWLTARGHEVRRQPVA